MEIAKKSFYRLDSDIAIASLFFATAYLAGAKRFIEVFPTANRQGLMFAAATSSLGLGGSQLLTNQIGLKKKTPLYLVYKSLVVAATALFTTSWLAKTFGREAKILSQDVTKFARVTTGVIVGAHCTRYLRPMPGKDVNLDKLESDIRILEAVPRSEWRMSDGVNAFNPDKILDIVGDDNVICVGVGGSRALYESLFTLSSSESTESPEPTEVGRVGRGAEATVSPSVQRAATSRIDQYSGWNGTDVRKNEVKWYLNKILLYLLSKKEAYQRDLDQTPEKLEALRALIDKVMVRIDDAHRGCIDQQTVQLKWLMIEIVDDFGLSEIEKLVALELDRYRSILIDNCINETGESHAADLGVDLTNSITRALGLPVTRATKHGACYKIYNPINYQIAKAKFFAAYDPVGHLVEQAKYYTQSKLFTEMCQWYGNKAFPFSLDESVEAERIKVLGSDFSSPEYMDTRKDAAVLYYLFKNGLITV